MRLTDERTAEALSLLDRLDGEVTTTSPRVLQEIVTTMIADARLALSGKAGWPPERVATLVSQIVSGQFGELCPVTPK